MCPCTGQREAKDVSDALHTLQVELDKVKSRGTLLVILGYSTTWVEEWDA